MAQQSKLDRNRQAILDDFERVLRETSADDFFGMGKLEWFVHGGEVRSVRSTPSRDRRIDLRDK